MELDDDREYALSSHRTAERRCKEVIFRSACEVRRAQPVDATPSDMNSFFKGGVYGTRKTGQALHGAED
jgi:hypothetical protein